MVLAQQTYKLTKQGALSKEIKENIKRNEQELEQAKQDATNAVQKADELTQQVVDVSNQINQVEIKLDTNLKDIEGQITEVEKATGGLQTTVSELNSQKIKGTNLLSGTASPVLKSPATTQNLGWRKAGKTEYRKDIVEISPPPVLGIKKGIQIENDSQNYNDSMVAQDKQKLEIGKHYILSVYARKIGTQNPKMKLTISGTGSKLFDVNGTEFQRYYFEFDAKQEIVNTFIGNINASSTLIICGMMLEQSSRLNEWSPCELDSVENISQMTQTINGFNQRVQNVEGQVTQNTQTVQGMQSTVSNLDGRVTTNTQTIAGFNRRVQELDGKVSESTQTALGLQATVRQNADKIGQLTLSSEHLQTDIRNLTNNTNSKFSQLSDRIDLKVSRGEVNNMIDIAVDGITISGSKVRITGDTYIQNGVIKDAMIANLKVDKLTGDLGKFYKLLFEDGNSNMALTSSGIRFSAYDKGNTWSNEYLEINSENLKWWSDGDHSQQYAYLGTAKRNRSMNITLGVVNNSNAGNDFPTLALRSAGLNTYISSRKSSIISGNYVYVGNNTADYESNSLYNSFSSASTDGNILSNTTSKVIIGANDGVYFRPGANKNDSVYFCKDYGWDSSSGIEFTRDNYKGMMIRAKGVYNNTGGDSPNLFIRSSGYIYRSTSARKYKEDIEYMGNLEQAKQLLNIDPASWVDKAEKNAFIAGREKTLPRRVGFIADDFYRLGLTDVVVKDEKGEIEGLAYDKISIYIIPLLKDLYYKLSVLEKEINKLKGGNK